MLIVGAPVSATFTVRVIVVAAFPASSLTLYESIYEPTVFASTEPLTPILFVMSPSMLSLAVDPGSTNIVPTS